MPTFKTILLAVLLYCIPAAVFSQTLVRNFPEVDGKVFTKRYDSINNRIYLGGTFQSVGYIGLGAVNVDSNGVTPDNWPKVDGTVAAILSDGTGGYYLGGYFTQIADKKCNYLGHVLANGEVDTTLAAPDGPVFSLALAGNKLIYGGSFTGVSNNKMSFPGHAALAKDGMLYDSFPSHNGLINQVIPDLSGGWFVAGTFTTIGNQPRNGIAHIGANWNVTSWNTTNSKPVLCVALHQGKVFTGGASSFQVFSASTGLELDSLSTNNTVTTICAAGSKVYFGGSFTNVMGLLKPRAACYDLNTGALTAWQMLNGAVSNVKKILLRNQRLLICGNSLGCYDTLSGTKFWDISLNNTSSTAPSAVNSIEEYNGQVFLGGLFTHVNPTGWAADNIRHNFGVVSLDSGKTLPFVLDSDNEIYDLQIDAGNNALVVIGKYNKIGNFKRRGYCELNLGTLAVSKRSFTANGQITSSVSAAGRQVLYGDLTQVNYGRSCIASVDLTTGKLTNWNPGADGGVKTIVPVNDRVYIGGEFRNVQDSTRTYAACISLVTDSLMGWNPRFNKTVNCLLHDSGYIFAGGAFDSVGLVARSCVAKTDTSGNLAPFAFTSSSPVNAMALYKHKIYFGLHSLYMGPPINPLVVRNKYTGASAGSISLGNQFVQDERVRALAADPVNNRLYVAVHEGFGTSLFCYRLSDDVMSTTCKPIVRGLLHCVGYFGDAVFTGGSSVSTTGRIKRKNFVAIDANTFEVLPLDIGHTAFQLCDFDFDDQYFYTVTAPEHPDPFDPPYVSRINRQTLKKQKLAYLNGTARIDVFDSSIYLMGGFSRVGDSTDQNRTVRYNFAEVNKSTGQLKPWNPNTGQQLTMLEGEYELLVHGDRVFFCGNITYPSSSNYKQLGSFNRFSGAPDPLGSTTTYTNSITIRDGTLYAMGNLFRSYNISTNTLNPLPVFSPSGLGLNQFTGFEKDEDRLYISGGVNSDSPVPDKTGLMCYAQDPSNTKVPYPVFYNYAGNKLLKIGNYLIGTDDGAGYSYSSEMRSEIGPFYSSYAIRVGNHELKNVNINGSHCADSFLQVSFGIADTFGIGNQFMVQLSDTGGSFGNSAQIGALNSLSASSIACTIPTNVQNSTGYQIRVISTRPYRVSEPVPYYILARPVNNQVIKGDVVVCANTMTAFYVNKIKNTTGHVWQIPAGWSIQHNQGDTLIVVSTDSVSGVVTLQGLNGCGLSLPVSKNITITKFIPDTPQSVTGADTVCRGSVQSYATDSVAGVTAYLWSVPAGWSMLSAQGKRTISVRADGAPGNLSVRLVSPCDTGAAFVKTISFTPEPSGIQLINTDTLCKTKQVTLQINPVSLATGYVWKLPAGWAKVSGDSTTALTVNVGAAGGMVTVKSISLCGLTKDSSSYFYNVHNSAQKPVSVTGADTICGKSSAVYSTAVIAGAQGYTWTVPNGWVITSGQGTNSITVDADSVSGNVTVRSFGVCDTSAATTKQVRIREAAPVPVLVGGTNKVCTNSPVLYSTPPSNKATGYIWSLPAGWQFISGQNTATINVTAGTASGNITVSTYTSCDTSAARSYAVSLKEAVTPPPAITGTDSVCSGSENTYTVPAQSGALSFKWVVPSGMNMVSGQGSNQVRISSSFAGTAVISVTVLGACDTAVAVAKTITMRTATATPAFISGADSTCNGVANTFEVTAVAGATGYLWKAGPGWNIVSGNGTALVTAKGNSVGIVQVAAYGLCDTSAFINKNISLHLPAPAPIISGPDSICKNTTATFTASSGPGTAGYTWRAGQGATFVSDSASTHVEIMATATGTISVAAYGFCDTSAATVKAFSVKLKPAKPVLIYGPDSTDATFAPLYRVQHVPGATHYTWYLPTGWSFADPQHTDTFALVHPGTVSGNVSVQAENECGSGDSLSRYIRVRVAIGLNEPGFESVNVFPNPTTGMITISGTNILNSSVKVFNVLGAVVYAGTLDTTNPISLQGLADGCYTLQLTRNNRSYTCKLVIIK